MFQMRSSGEYRYRWAGMEVGRELWSIRPEANTWRYQADIVCNHIRTEIHLNDAADSARPLHVGLKRTTPDGETGGADYHFADGLVHLAYTDRNSLRREGKPRPWPEEGVFAPLALCMMTHAWRRTRLLDQVEHHFPVFIVPRKGLSLGGHLGKGRLREQKTQEMTSVLGDIQVTVWEARFERFPVPKPPLRLSIDRQGICHRAEYGLWRFELVELEVADNLTPLPIRVRKWG